MLKKQYAKVNNESEFYKFWSYFQHKSGLWNYKFCHKPKFYPCLIVYIVRYPLLKYNLIHKYKPKV